MTLHTRTHAHTHTFECDLQATEGILSELTFRPEQVVISMVAMVNMEQLTSLLAPVPPANICRVCPLPPIARHLGATIVCPKHPVAAALFDSFGATVQVDTEVQLAQLQAVTCLMGPMYAMQQTCQGWLCNKGLPAEAAAKYIGAMFHAVADDAKVATVEGDPAGFAHLISEQTPGGLNEGAIAMLKDASVFTAYESALDATLNRLQGL